MTIHKVKILNGSIHAKKNTTTVANMETTCFLDLKTEALSATTYVRRKLGDLVKNLIPPKRKHEGGSKYPNFERLVSPLKETISLDTKDDQEILHNKVKSVLFTTYLPLAISYLSDVLLFHYTHQMLQLLIM